MEIVVTAHAIEQYRNKTFTPDAELEDQEICRRITNICKKGTRAGRKAGASVYKICYEGLAVVAKVSPNKIIAITYLGDREYQHWYKMQDRKTRRRAGCR